MKNYAIKTGETEPQIILKALGWHWLVFQAKVGPTGWAEQEPCAHE